MSSPSLRVPGVSPLVRGSVLAVGLALAAAAPVNATEVTFTFDPDDFIQLYSTTPLPASWCSAGSHCKYDQENPRRVHETWGGIMHNTFGTTDVGQTDAQSQTAYINWRNSLDTSSEGISSFNIWLRDNANAWNWGERLVSNPDKMPTATAASGWQYSVIANPWGTGWLVEWWTDETNNLINLANNLDPFSFKVDVRQISAPGQTFAAGGVDISSGTTWDIWFGSYSQNGISNAGSQYASWQGWEGTLALRAVPEPAALALFGIGLAGLAFLRRRRWT